MKKLASLAIAGLAVTAFAACGDDDTEDPGGSTPTEDTGDTGDTMTSTPMTEGTMAPGTTAGG